MPYEIDELNDYYTNLVTGLNTRYGKNVPLGPGVTHENTWNGNARFNDWSRDVAPWADIQDYSADSPGSQSWINTVQDRYTGLGLDPETHISKPWVEQPNMLPGLADYFRANGTRSFDYDKLVGTLDPWEKEYLANYNQSLGGQEGKQNAAKAIQAKIRADSLGGLSASDYWDIENTFNNIHGAQGARIKYDKDRTGEAGERNWRLGASAILALPTGGMSIPAAAAWGGTVGAVSGGGDVGSIGYGALGGGLGAAAQGASFSSAAPRFSSAVPTGSIFRDTLSNSNSFANLGSGSSLYGQAAGAGLRFGAGQLKNAAVNQLPDKFRRGLGLLDLGRSAYGLGNSAYTAMRPQVPNVNTFRQNYFKGLLG